MAPYLYFAVKTLHGFVEIIVELKIGALIEFKLIFGIAKMQLSFSCIVVCYTKNTSYGKMILLKHRKNRVKT